MFDNDFFDEWLNEEVHRVQNKIKAGQTLDADDKVLLILKAQVNHLDIDLRQDVKDLRNDIDKRFEQVVQRFEQSRIEMDYRFAQNKLGKRFDWIDKRFEKMDKHFEQTQDELKKVYQAINAQTWKMIAAIGLIVILDATFQ